jgi:hypothetical protein
MTRQGKRVGSDCYMKHAASRELYAYWQEKRGDRPAPERTEIDPGAIRGVLADAFILALDHRAGHPVRLAGTRTCALFGREIKGEPFLDLWALPNRATVEGLLSILRDECTGTVAGASARNEDGESIELELLLLPLSIQRPVFARAIGVLAPLKIPPWLGTSPVGPVTLGGRRHVGATVEKRLLPRLMGPRGRLGFVVFEGGRSLAGIGEDGPSAA